MAIFFGTSSGNVIVAGVAMTGFSGGSLAETEDGVSDAYYGFGGNDYIIAGASSDVLVGGTGDDYLSGGDGSDQLYGSYGYDVLVGGEGNDTFHIEYEDFADDVSGGRGYDTLDLSMVTGGGCRVDLLAGNYKAVYGGYAPVSSIEAVVGSQQADFIVGADNGEVLAGGKGADAIWGGGGTDYIYGGAGDDVVRGDGGIDVVFGEDGDDVFVFADEHHFDLVYGGAGRDQLFFGSLDSTGVIVNLAANVFSRTDGFGAPQTVEGIERVYGSILADTIIGSSASEDLFGGLGNDNISGGGGADFVTGSLGTDRLRGGLGADDFIFASPGDSGKTSANRDTILDFACKVDDIDASLIDAKAHTSGNQAFAFIGKHGFTGEGQIRAYQSGADTIIEFNTSGSYGAEMTLKLANFNVSLLSSVDFIL